ncbi:hypothetical protein GCM10009725_07260 [Aeromicrobium tamlense]
MRPGGVRVARVLQDELEVAVDVSDDGVDLGEGETKVGHDSQPRASDGREPGDGNRDTDRATAALH